MRLYNVGLGLYFEPAAIGWMYTCIYGIIGRGAAAAPQLKVLGGAEVRQRPALPPCLPPPPPKKIDVVSHSRLAMLCILQLPNKLL